MRLNHLARRVHWGTAQSLALTVFRTAVPFLLVVFIFRLDPESQSGWKLKTLKQGGIRHTAAFTHRLQAIAAVGGC
ncbi:MAG: hypothetical protein ACI915_002041 [Gammaproteobacteria bacterium]|jgi:hypothetical protein